MRGNRRDQERAEKSGALNPNKLGSPRILLDRNYRVVNLLLLSLLLLLLLSVLLYLDIILFEYYFIFKFQPISNNVEFK